MIYIKSGNGKKIGEKSGKLSMKSEKSEFHIVSIDTATAPQMVL